MPETRPVTLAGTVTDAPALQPLPTGPGGIGPAAFTLATILNTSPTPGAPARPQIVLVQCSAAHGTVADEMFDHVKRGAQVVVQGTPLLQGAPGARELSVQRLKLRYTS